MKRVMTDNRPASPIFVGRRAELSLLEALFEEAGSGGGQRTVLLGAEAGGGKSRLISEFVKRTEGHGHALRGACIARAEAGVPYAPFTAALRGLVREQGVEGIAAIVGEAGRGELARLIPGFGSPSHNPDPDEARARLFELILGLLETLGDRRPLVLAIEDVHWADSATRDLLSFLASNAQHVRMMLVASFRSEEVYGGHPLRSLFTELARMEGVVSLNLPRLTRSEVGAQLEGILGDRVSPGLLRSVYDRGQGIPLFTEILVAPDGSLRPGLPGNFRDLLLGLVRELPEATQRVLRTAAVAGVQVKHGLLAGAVGMGEDELAAALRPAVTSNVLLQDSDGYAFRHALIQEAVRDDLLIGERRTIHRAYAEALESSPSAPPDVWVALAKARHWRAAGDELRALGAAWEAGAEAAARTAYPEQLEMLEQVLDLWPLVPHAEGVIGSDRVGVLELAADAACWAVEPERGLAHVEAALATLDEGDAAPRVAAMLLQRAIMRRQRLLPGEIQDLWSALCLASRPDRLRAETLGQLCRALMYHGRSAEAVDLVRELDDLADALGDAEFSLEAAIARAQLPSRTVSESLDALNRSVHAARELRLGRIEMIGYVAIIGTLERDGQFARAVEVARVAGVRTVQVGQGRYMGATIAQHLARSLIALGRWDDAEEVLRDAAELDAAPYGRAQILLRLCEVKLGRGDLHAAAEVLGELRRPLGTEADYRAYAAAFRRLEIELHLAEGDVAGAAGLAHGVPALCEGADGSVVWPLLATAFRACVDANGDPGLRAALSGIADRIGQTGPVEAAYAAQCAAELARLADGSDSGPWDAAAAAWSELHQPYMESYALARAAAATAAQRDRRAAGDRLNRAIRLAMELGAASLLSSMAELARRTGVAELAEEAVAPAALPFGLTQREMTVLRLVAEGLSNRAIAAQLYISPKTASVHVSNILSKLKVSGRGAAAAVARRSHLLNGF